MPEHYRDWHHGVQDAIDADVLKRRDSLEELERDLGLTEGVLTEAVAKWNDACERGEDDFLYPMPAEWLHPIGGAALLRLPHRRQPVRHEGGAADQRPDAGGGHRRPGDPRPVRRLAHRRGRRVREQLHRRPDSGIAHGGRGGSPSAAGICAAPLRWRTRSQGGQVGRERAYGIRIRMKI